MRYPGKFFIPIVPASVLIACISLVAPFCGSGVQLLSTPNSGAPFAATGDDNSSSPIISPDGRFVLFESFANDLTPGGNGLFKNNLYLRDRNNQTTTLVTANVNGLGGNGDSSGGDVSTNGRYAVFQSDASDLLPDDTNGATDIFLRDMLSGTTTLISVATNGGFGNGASTSPVMSPDGRFIAFISAASNLAASDTNNGPDIFVRDVLNQTTTLVSVGVTASNATFASPLITPDGKRVVFFSTATNLAPGVPALSKGEIYVRDLMNGVTFWASTNAANVVSNLFHLNYMPSQHPAISDDGNFIAFRCGWTNGATPPSPGVPKALIYQYNIAGGTSVLVATNAFSATAYSDDVDVYGPEMTPDGRFIVYIATNNAPVSSTSVRLWDAQSGTNILVSAAWDGSAPIKSTASQPLISSDGRFVVFLSDATNLVTTVISNGIHAYLRDLQSNTTQLIDVDTNGVGSIDLLIQSLSLNANGQFVAFDGGKGGLVAGKSSNNQSDVFVRDMAAGVTEFISQRDASVISTAGNNLSVSGLYSLSADGRWVAFASLASNLVTNDFNNSRDIFVSDLLTGSNILASIGLDGNAGLGGPSFSPAISADGHFVAFSSFATNLVANDTNGATDVFIRDLQSGSTRLASVNASGIALGTGESSYPVISQEGRYVAFLCKLNSNAAYPSTFWRDMITGTTVTLNTAAVNGPAMSANGQRVVFFDSSSHLYVWDAQLVANIYTNTATISSAALSPDGNRLLLHNLTTRQMSVWDLTGNSNVVSFANTVPIKGAAQWSSDGRFFVFAAATNFVTGGGNGTNAVYLDDLQTGTLTLLSGNAAGTASAGGQSDWPVISADGRFIVYRSLATDIIPGVTNVPSLYCFDRRLGATSLLATGSAESWSHWVAQPLLSTNGSRVIFSDWDNGQISGDLNRSGDVLAQPQSVLMADSDGDGIPDWWTMKYFGHPTGSAGDFSRAQDDADGDGMSNLQEYLAGTSPTDATSIFQLQISPAALPASGPDLKWPAVLGHSYQLQFKTNLTDSVWLNVSGNARVAGSQGYYSLPAPGPSSTGYYRIAASAN